MIYSNGRPSTTESRRACPCCAACEGVNCNGGGTVAAAPISALTMVPRCGLIECVCIPRAVLPRETSQLRAHCPLFWPQMLN